MEIIEIFKLDKEIYKSEKCLKYMQYNCTMYIIKQGQRCLYGKIKSSYIGRRSRYKNEV